MAMENGPFEDAFPIKDGDIPASYVSLSENIVLKNRARVESQLLIFVDFCKLCPITFILRGL